MTLVKGHDILLGHRQPLRQFKVWTCDINSSHKNYWPIIKLRWMDRQTDKKTKLDMVILIYSQNFIRRSIKKEYKNIIEMIWKTFSHTAIKKVQIWMQ